MNPYDIESPIVEEEGMEVGSVGGHPYTLRYGKDAEGVSVVDYRTEGVTAIFHAESFPLLKRMLDEIVAIKRRES